VKGEVKRESRNKKVLLTEISVLEEK